MGGRHEEANHQMRGARVNVKLDTVVIAFQHCLDYHPLSLLHSFAAADFTLALSNRFALDTFCGGVGGAVSES